MSWSYRKQVTFLIPGLILLALVGLATSFLRLYWNDKLASILHDELANTEGAASQITGLLNLAEVITGKAVEGSQEIMFVFEDPCSPGAFARGSFSRQFKDDFEKSGTKPTDWLAAVDVFRACADIEAAKRRETPGEAVTSEIHILPNQKEMMDPYLAAVIRGAAGTRLVMIATTRIASTESSTLFILDRDSNLLWAPDGASYVNEALKDTDLSFERMKPALADARAGNSKTIAMGSSAFLSYARVSQDWVLLTLDYRYLLLRSVYFAMAQAFSLCAGFLFLSILIGKNMGAILVKPFTELKMHAEAISKGNLNMNFEITGDNEVSEVKKAFNFMMKRIHHLLSETEEKTRLESELQVAQQVQTLLLPNRELVTQSHKINSYVKAAEKCGGDWWGTLEIQRPGRSPLCLITVGDVTGHGVPSALIAATLRGSLSILSEWFKRDPEVATDPSKICSVFNRTVWDAARGTIGATLFVAILDPESQTITYANAGHNFPYMMIPSKDGAAPKLRSLNKSGMVLGQQQDWEAADIGVEPWELGQQFFIYTDGLLEELEEDKPKFQRRDLQKTLTALLNQKGDNVIRGLLKRRKEKVGETRQSDDITLVVCEFTHRPQQSVATEEKAA